MNKKIIVVGTALFLSMLTGCTLMPDDDLFTDIDNSNNNISQSDNDISNEGNTDTYESSTDNENNTKESESYIEIVVDNSDSDKYDDPFSEYETVPIEDLEEPVDENGEWLNYTLFARPLEITFEKGTYGENGSRFYIEDYPVIMTSDSDEFTKIEQTMWPHLENKVTERFLFYNIDIDLKCELMSATRFVSYQISGTVYHTGDDDRFEDEVEYRYYCTFDRMTGQCINLETALGVKEAYEQIKNGQYKVIRAEDSVFERFSDELLADIYINDPLFEDDISHELDFYIQDGYVCVVIWVGEDNGNYAILRLDSPSKI